MPIDFSAVIPSEDSKRLFPHQLTHALLCQKAELALGCALRAIDFGCVDIGDADALAINIDRVSVNCVDSRLGQRCCRETDDDGHGNRSYASYISTMQHD